MLDYMPGEAISLSTTAIGGAAAVCTTLANLPQLKKAWTTGETDDLSLKTLVLLASGVALWVVYGLIQGDMVIVVANGISLVLAIALICLKLGVGPVKASRK